MRTALRCKSGSRRTFPILRPRGRKFRDVCHYGADSRPATLSASNRESSSNDRASISTSQAISGAFGRGAVSGCRRQPRHVRVRRQAGCSVSFRRRMAGGQGHLRSHRAGPHPRCKGPSGEVTRWTSRRSTPCELSSAPNSWRPSPGDRWHRRCPSKSARCSPSPSQTASWLRTRSRRRRNDVGGLIIIGNIRGAPLAIDVSGEQTLNIGKADQIAQNVAPSPGSAVSSVTSAHDVTR